MTSFLSIVVILILTSVGLTAQNGSDRMINENARRARPQLDPDFFQAPPKNGLPLIQSIPGISQESGWFLNRNLIAESSIQPFPQNESSIAVNPLSPNRLIASAVDARGCYVYMSSDGGKTWVNRSMGAVGSWQSGNDPSVGFDYLGNAYLMYGAFEAVNGRNGVYVSKSTDNGTTWNRYVVIEHSSLPTKDTAFEDKYYIQIDNSPASPYRGRLYTPWKRVIDRDSSTQIMVARSLDGGLTWLAPVAASARHTGVSYDTTFGQSFPLTTTGPDGTLYVVWNDGPNRSIGFSKSTDGGQSFSVPSYPVRNYPTLGTARKSGSDVYHVLKNTFRAETYPAFTADNSQSIRKGWIYLVYAAGTSPDIFFIRSTDGGLSWTPPRTIHSETRGDQWWPWIMVDPINGDLAVVCSDSREDSLNIATDQYVAYSSDGGDTWIDHRATSAQSDFRKNPYVDHIFAGDYSGGAFYNGRIYPSALDTRTGNNDVFTEILSIKQPLPVENLRVTSLTNDVLTAKLTWKNPLQQISPFGKAYSDYWIVVQRDGSLAATLPAGTTSYQDPGRILNQKYTYTVSVAIPEDTSASRTVTFTAGEARLPFAPVISARDYTPQIQIEAAMPVLRADSVTPLENLSGYHLYRDGQLVGSGTLLPSDTGKVVTITDTPPIRGYYQYSVTVLDGSAPSNESARSDTVVVYAGTLLPYTEHFDGITPKFLCPVGWGTTDSASFSSPNSFTDSPGGDYPSRRTAVLQIFPVEMTGNVDLTFAHIAIVDPSDTASVEVSYDRGATWQWLKFYNFNSDPSWADKKANPGDWRFEQITLRHPSPGPGATGLVRFVLRSLNFTNADGWYLDDISFGSPSGVAATGNTVSTTVVVAPNPFSESALISFTLNRPGTVTLRLIDALGRTVETRQFGTIVSGLHSVQFQPGLLGFGNGMFYYELRTTDGVFRGRMMYVGK